LDKVQLVHINMLLSVMMIAVCWRHWVTIKVNICHWSHGMNGGLSWWRLWVQHCCLVDGTLTMMSHQQLKCSTTAVLKATLQVC